MAQSFPGVSCIPVVLKDTVLLEPGKEYLVRAFSTVMEEEKDYLFIPDHGNLEKRGIISADCVVCNRYSGFPIRVFNANDDLKTMFQRTRVGWIIELACVSDTLYEDSGLICALNDQREDKQEFLKAIKINDAEKSEINDIGELLWDYRDVFSKSKRDLGCAGIKHEIITDNHPPIALKQRRIPLALEAKVDEQIQQMLEDNIIRESTSPWSFPLVVVRKPNGDLRLCVDYRKLNEITRRPIFPIPDSRTLFDALEGNKYFSTIDLSSGYHQVPMKEIDKEKTAFSTRRGQFEFNRMPFGLCGAPATFQRIMNVVLKDQVWEKCVIYLDDVLIFGRSIEEHNQRLREVLEQFRKADMKLSPQKCSFLQKEVSYLGHVIGSGGISVDPQKIKSVLDWPTPKCVEEVHSFVGLCSYYRSFIEDFSKIVEPMQRIIASKKFKWEKEQAESFARMKNLLTNAPILALPSKEGTYILDTDASYGAIGAVLSQEQNGTERVLAYASNKLTKTQRNYCITRKELLAAYHYIKHFKHYLAGEKFVLRTDHKALIWLLNWKKPNTSQYCLWKADLEGFSFEIQHRKGTNHLNADALSRELSCEKCEQCELQHANPQKRRNVKLTNQQYLQEASVEENMILSTSILKEETSMYSTQFKNRDIQKIKMWLHNEMIDVIEPDGYKDLTSFGKGVWKVRKSLRIRGDVLYHMYKDGQTYQFVVVPNMVEALLNSFHDNLGHLGVYKCSSMIKTRFFWPQMLKDINDYVSRCRLCIQFKEKNGKNNAMVQQIASRRPFHRVCIDICGPLERSRNGFRYVLGIVDHFSKYLVLVPLRTIDARAVSTALWKEWITKFGCPEILFSDSGKVFTSEMIANICAACKIGKLFSAPYHQQANGLIERVFKTIKPMIVMMSRQQGKCWDEVIPTVEFAIRAAVQENTGYSPFEIVFGSRVRIPGDSEIVEHQNTSSISEYMKMIKMYKTVIQKEVRKRQQSNLVVMDRYRKKYSPIRIEKGDQVFIRNHRRTAFDDEKYFGPLEVIGKEGEHTYILRKEANGRIYSRHFNDIKRVKSTVDKNKRYNNGLSIWSPKPGVSCGRKVMDNQHQGSFSDNQNHESVNNQPDATSRTTKEQRSQRLPTGSRYPKRTRRPVQRFGMMRGEC